MFTTFKRREIGRRSLEYCSLPLWILYPCVCKRMRRISGTGPSTARSSPAQNYVLPFEVIILPPTFPLAPLNRPGTTYSLLSPSSLSSELSVGWYAGLVYVWGISQTAVKWGIAKLSLTCSWNHWNTEDMHSCQGRIGTLFHRLGRNHRFPRVSLIGVYEPLFNVL